MEKFDLKLNYLTKEEITTLIKQAYSTAVNHGWHEEVYSPSHYIVMIITEFCEAIEADRKGRRADMNGYKVSEEYYKKTLAINTDMSQYLYENYIKDTVEDEMADAVIRLLDWAGYLAACGENIYIDICPLNSIVLHSGETFTEIVYWLIQNLIFNGINFNLKIEEEINEILSLAENKGVNLIEIVCLKMVYNKHRPYKHGDKKY